jgi:coenzyme Q-binding protein COQ10
MQGALFRFVVLAAVLTATPATALDIESLDPATIVALTADGPLVAIDETADGRLEMATAAVTINASPDRVWDVLADFESYPEWMPQTTAVSVLESGAGTQKVALILEFNLVITKKVGYTIEYRDRGNHRMEYSLVDGDFSRNEGYWVVHPHGAAQSILYYANYVDYTSMNLLRAFLKRQPSLELALGASGVAVIVRSVKERVEST